MRNCLLILLLGLAACTGPQETNPRDFKRDSAWLQSQLAELETLPCPPGCDPDAWLQLKAGLARSISHGLEGKAASTPPRSEAARPLIHLDPTFGTFFWHFESPGDYDQNGEVNISDLTPLGANLNETAG